MPPSAQAGEDAPTGAHQGVHFDPLQTRPCAQSPIEEFPVQGVPAISLFELKQSKSGVFAFPKYWQVVPGPQGGAPMSGWQWAVHTRRPGIVPLFTWAVMQDAPLAQSAGLAQKGLHTPVL
jgi:hypothetical protein